MSSSLPLVRALLAAGCLVLALSACGRRGALEAPPDPAAADEEAEGTLPSPVGTPRRSNPKRGYVIPSDPFLLDPLL
jgi:predicted small lipoprotein YifL